MIAEPVVILTETISENRDVHMAIQRILNTLWLHPGRKFKLQLLLDDEGYHPDPFSGPEEIP